MAGPPVVTSGAGVADWIYIAKIRALCERAVADSQEQHALATQRNDLFAIGKSLQVGIDDLLTGGEAGQNLD